MQSFFLVAAALSAVANAGVLPRQDSTCTEGICGSTSTVQHTVVSGETLGSIATDYKSGICDIATVNKIENINLITPGQVLTIPKDCTTPDNESCNPPVAPTPTETCVPGVGSSYDVRSGDTFTAIANSFNITLAALEGANSQVKNFDAIAVGQIINVPICPESSCDSVGTYVIASGDTIFDLTTKFGGVTVGQVLALNYAVDPTKLAVGQQIIFPKGCHNGTQA